MVTTPRRVGDPSLPRDGGAPLTARLLGRPRFAWRGRALDVRSRKERALLAHLAARDAAVPRAELAELLWGPGRLRNVRQALYGLRRQPGADAWLVEEGDEGVRVVADCDLLDFEAAVARGEHAAALALWSDGLLEGLVVDDAPAFADWREVERERLVTLYRDALRGTVRALEADDRPREALAAAERLLAADDLDEGAHRAAMRAAHRLHGRDAAALRFETCRRILRTELGVDPSDETRRLAAALGRDEPAPPPEPEPPAPPARATPRPRLHGRATARRDLAAAVAAGATVLVTGPAGIGKTRLVHELHAERPAVHLSSAREGDRHAPYATVARILAESLRARPELAGPPARRAELARLLPETLGPVPSGGAARGGDEARERLRGAVLTTLATACEGTTLVVDDLRHADEASLDLIAALATTATPSPGRPHLVLVAREEDGRPDLASRLRRLVATGARTVRLGGLDAAAVRALLADLGPAPSEDDGLRVLAGRLQRYTGGNPMFVLETVADLAARHGRLDAEVAFGLPDRVGALLRHRLDELPPDALRVARTLHLLGPEADADVVARVVDLDPARYVAALEVLEAARVLHDDRFAHDLVREAIAAHTPAAVRRFLHARAARVLEASPASSEPGRIAEHRLHAGEPDRAAPHLVAAARQAVERFEDDEARRRLFAALWAGSTMREGAPALRAEALLGLEAIAARRGDEDEAAWALREVEALAAHEQDDALLFEAHLRRAAERIRRGRPADAATEAEAALAIGERTGHRDRVAKGALQAGGAAFAAGDLGRASAAFERAAATDVATVRLRAVANLGAIAGIRGDAAEARRRQEEALTLARAHGTLDQVAALLNNLAATDEREGRYPRANERFAEAVTLARRSGDVAKERAARLNLVEVDTKRGAFASAERALDAVERALPDAAPAVASRARLLRGELECALGRPEIAARAFEEALAFAREADDGRAEAVAAFDLARARALAKGTGAATDLREALEALAALGLEDVAAWARLELLWVASDADLPEPAGDGDASPHRALLVELARHRAARRTGAERPDRATLAALAARAPVAEAPIAHGLLAALASDAATAARHRERGEALLRDQTRGLPAAAGASRRRVVDDAIRLLL